MGVGMTEREIGELEARIRNVELWLESVDRKVDRLLEAAAMGKGAWWATLKIGGLLVLLAAAGAWVFDHLGGRP
jgi:hypothetical protein